jgi:outer membrane protein
MRLVSTFYGFMVLAGLTTANYAQGQSAVSPGLGASAATAVAPSRVNLQQCIDIARQNNLSIRQGQLTTESTALQLRQSQLNQLPNAVFQGGESRSGGRNIDPRTNQFVQQSITSGNYQLSSSATLFSGFILKNTIKQNDLALQATRQELRTTENNISLNVAQFYLNVLTNTEQLVAAQRQADVTRAQLSRTERLVAAGSLPEANLYDLRAQLANNELDIVNAQNNVDLAKVSLLQVMNVPINLAIEVEPVAVPDPTVAPYAQTVQQIYEIAERSLPEVAGTDLRVRAANMGVEVAKGGLFPTVTINGNLSTLYSSAAQQQILNGQVSQQPLPYFATTADGKQLPIFATVQGYDLTGLPVGTQFGNNLNRSVSLSLRMPIFQAYQAKNRIASARIQQQGAELTAQNVRLQLRQQIETAYTTLRASANRYIATQSQVTSLEKAFAVSESRLNAGAINATDYNVAKSNLDRARASLIQSRYDYVFRTKILDFYQNKPLSF